MGAVLPRKQLWVSAFYMYEDLEEYKLGITYSLVLQPFSPYFPD